MDDGDRTPIPEVCAFHPGCVSRIEKLEAASDAVRLGLVEAVGQSGRNGRLGRLEETVGKLEEAIKEQRSFLRKAFLAVLAAASGGSGAAYAIIKAMGG